MKKSELIRIIREEIQRMTELTSPTSSDIKWIGRIVQQVKKTKQPRKGTLEIQFKDGSSAHVDAMANKVTVTKDKGYKDVTAHDLRQFHANTPHGADSILQYLAKATNEVVTENKVMYSAPTKDGNEFQIVQRDTRGMRGKQDPFKMQIVDKRGKVIDDLGSHPTLVGAKKFGQRFI